MKASSVLATYSSVSHSSFCLFVHTHSKSPFVFSNHHQIASSSFGKCCRMLNFHIVSPLRSSDHHTPTLSLAKILDTDSLSSGTFSRGDMLMPKTDKSGRFSSPRAGRELALLILYAACLEGSDPVRLFDKRVNAPREHGYGFNKASLLEYNHMSFGEPPVTTDTLEEAEELLHIDKKESQIEADVLSAPPKLVYSKLILNFTRKLLLAVVETWDSHVAVINKVVPPSWKDKPASKILELSILHLAMSEIEVVGTRHQIVINEAVDLAKRFCDGAAPRTVNGCLRTFINFLEKADTA